LSFAEINTEAVVVEQQVFKIKCKDK